MKFAVLVSSEKEAFSPVAQMLTQKEVRLVHTRTGEGLRKLMAEAAPDLIIISSSLPDMAPRPLIAAVVEKSPFSHCVVAGAMEKKAFHDEYEGYGVLMQINESPTPADVESLSARLDKLMQLGSF